MLYLGVVLLEASWSEQYETTQVGGLLCHAACDSIDEQGGAPKAVPHCPHSVGLLSTAVASAAAPLAFLAAVSVVAVGPAIPSYPSDKEKQLMPVHAAIQVLLHNKVCPWLSSHC